ncbi:MAG: L-threonylcarbamoyladenylate synthase [Thermoanaerobaculia bacterium]|nr:L-threonylcarbamoyladenylate synthase [Thermoanaerobaculia bacterium]
MTAAELLAAGGVLAVPTESSYGLGVDPRDAQGVEAIYRLKGRERGKALPVVAADVAQLLALGVQADSQALAWARPRWPAALTVVLPLTAPIAASAGAPTIAARIPAHEGLRALLGELGHALTATSANPSGEPPLTNPNEVRSWLEASAEKFLVVDQGTTAGGAPSTLVALSDGEVVILRKGRDEVG